MTGLTWENGIIGKIETFLLKRFPIGKMWARAIGTTIVSSALGKVTLEDKWGDVRPSVWFLYVAPSGLGCKTPPIKFTRKIMKEFNPTLLAPSRFTPEGFTEWTMGVKKTKTKEGENRQLVDKHPVNVLIRDEMSKLLGETQQRFLIMKEYLSELWDGYIEGYYTRQYQYEGEIPVYVVMLSASSDLFFDLLNEQFFKQGLGNRILWIIEDNLEPEKLDPKEFFFAFGKKDEEFINLQKETINHLQTIAEVVNLAFIYPGAGEMWTTYQHECALKAHKAEALISSYQVKQPLNALKLTIVYAVSRLDYNEYGVISVREEDMKRAIEDTKIYTEMWNKAMSWWQEIKGRKEERIRSVKYDLRRFVEYGLTQKDSLFTAQMIRGTLELPDLDRIDKILLVGQDKGWLKIVAETGSQGILTDEQYKPFRERQERGFTARIWQVTKLGQQDNKIV